MSQRGVIVDLDGTLVDSVYRHVGVWSQVLREHGHRVPAWRIHRGIGMGGRRLLRWLLAGHCSADEIETLIDAHADRFLADAADLTPTAGARRLLADLDERQIPWRIATSASGQTLECLLAPLRRDDLEDRTLDADEVDASKPAPEQLLASADRLELPPERITFIGDTPWDGEAALRAGMTFIGVRCGGFPQALLRDAGALWVENAPRDLIGRL